MENLKPSVVRARHYWAFQANPEKYDILKAVESIEMDTWLTKRSDVRKGDRALIWKSLGRSNDRGIVAFAEVMTVPLMTEGISEFWIGESQNSSELRVQIRYVKLPHGPIWANPATEPILSKLSVSGSQGTVFKIPPELWEEVVNLAGGWPDTIAVEIRRHEEVDDFDVKSVSDSRTRIARAIVTRRGQPSFRERMLQAYGGRCAMSGCDVKEVLEAAHIIPYQGKETNHIQNGLLLRADIHTLFDLGLITVNLEDFRIQLDERLKFSSYGELDKKLLSLPTHVAQWPDKAALDDHRDNAEERFGKF
jgi:hypothetical protein